MKKSVLIITALFMALACKDQNPKNGEKSVPGTTNFKVEDTLNREQSTQEIAQELKEKGHQVFLYPEGDTTYLMQQYYIVFLKAGENRGQDSLERVRLMEQHLAHLTRMAEEGFSSLTGPMGDDGELRGIVVYNTPTMAEADSLANLDPMVKAGRLKVEVHPWWTAKGGKLP